MNAGEFNMRIQICEDNMEINSGGGFGGVDKQPKVIVECWAKVETTSGKEIYQAQQDMVEFTHKITIRYRPTVKRNMYVLFRGRRFDIGYLFNTKEKNQYLELYCIERD